MGNVTNLRPPWQRGQSGNPGDKSPGTRNKFSEAFFRDFYASWEKHGTAVIERVIAEDPVAYLRIAAGLGAKLDAVQPEDLTRDRIRRAIAICEELESAVAGSGAGDREPEQLASYRQRRKRQSELIRRWRPWDRSTGPRTADGKTRNSKNAYEGGIRPALRALARILREGAVIATKSTSHDQSVAG